MANGGKHTYYVGRSYKLKTPIQDSLKNWYHSIWLSRNSEGRHVRSKANEKHWVFYPNFTAYGKKNKGQYGSGYPDMSIVKGRPIYKGRGKERFLKSYEVRYYKQKPTKNFKSYSDFIKNWRNGYKVDKKKRVK